MLAALNFKILWNLYFTNYSFRCTFEPFKCILSDKPLIQIVEIFKLISLGFRNFIVKSNSCSDYPFIALHDLFFINFLFIYTQKCTRY